MYFRLRMLMDRDLHISHSFPFKPYVTLQLRCENRFTCGSFILILLDRLTYRQFQYFIHCILLLFSFAYYLHTKFSVIVLMFDQSSYFLQRSLELLIRSYSMMIKCEQYNYCFIVLTRLHFTYYNITSLDLTLSFYSISILSHNFRN